MIPKMGLKTYLRLTAASVILFAASASAQTAVDADRWGDGYNGGTVSSLPDLAPETIAADTRTRIVDGRAVVEAPTFNPFEDSDRGFAGEAYLRSSRGEFDRRGEPLPDGAVLDVSLIYASGSDDPYDVRGFEDAVFLSGELSQSVRYDSDVLECSSRVTDVVYRDDYYSGVSHGLVAGLYMPFPFYRGHRHYGYSYTPYYPGGYYRFRDGRRYRHGRGPIGRAGFAGYRHGYRHGRRDGYRDGRIYGDHGGRVRDGRVWDGRNRDGRVRDGRRGDDRVREGRDRDRRARDNSPTRPVRNLGSRGTGDRGMDRLEAGPNRIDNPAVARERRRDIRREARPESRRPEVGRPDTRRAEPRGARPLRGGGDTRRAVPTDRPELRLENRQPTPRRPVTQSRERVTDRRRVSPKNYTPSRAEPRRAEPKRSSPKRAAPQRSAPKRSAPKRSTPNRVNRATDGAFRGSEARGKRRFDYYPRGTRVSTHTESRCAKRESLGLFIPAERLEAARFDGLTVVLLSRTGEEVPVYVPPNYIEGFRQAARF